VNVEFHQTFAAHFQKQRLAGFLIHDIGAFHDLVDLERFSRSAFRIFSRSFSMAIPRRPGNLVFTPE
jgi:hypothetical protein